MQNAATGTKAAADQAAGSIDGAGSTPPETSSQAQTGPLDEECAVLLHACQRAIERFTGDPELGGPVLLRPAELDLAAFPFGLDEVHDPLACRLQAEPLRLRPDLAQLAGEMIAPSVPDPGTAQRLGEGLAVDREQR